MSKRVRVNVRSLANTKAVRREKRNGRDVLIVPSATLPDDVVMNDVLYPADEIEKSYLSLNRSPAPAGHPLINNQFVSAYDPEASNIFGIGAWNENARRENGRVFLDKVIDVERANQSERGRKILNAIDKGEPVHTSTGLYCNLEAVSGDADHSHVAQNIEFDHDAILIGEIGAATPEQGVGMMINASGETQQVEVINSVLEEAERDLEWAADLAVRAVDRMERASLIDRITSAIKAAVSGEEKRETTANKGDAGMADDKQLEELSAKVNALSESAVTKDDMAATINEALKPLIDAQQEVVANQKAKDEAEHSALVNKVVAAKIDGIGEEVAKKMDAVALNALLEMSQKQNSSAAALSGGFFSGSNTGVDLSPLAGVKQ